MVNVHPAGDARRAPNERATAVGPKTPPPGVRTSFAAGVNPADTLRKAVRDLETAGQGLAGEAATLVRSATDELRSALTALEENGDVGSEPEDAALRADLQQMQEQQGPGEGPQRSERKR